MSGILASDILAPGICTSVIFLSDKTFEGIAKHLSVVAT